MSSSTHGKIVKAKDHVQFDINFYSESFHICYADSLCCPDWWSCTGEHSYISFFVIFFMFWWCFKKMIVEKLLRQKITSSLISSSILNFFIITMLIHYDVLIDNQSLVNIPIYIFHIFFIFSWCFNLEKSRSWKIVKAKDHVQFDINFYSESFHICYADSLYCTNW